MKVTKKLLLNKETIKVLTRDELVNVAGGGEGCPYTASDYYSSYPCPSGTGSGSSAVRSVCADPN